MIRTLRRDLDRQLRAGRRRVAMLERSLKEGRITQGNPQRCKAARAVQIKYARIHVQEIAKALEALRAI